MKIDLYVLIFVLSFTDSKHFYKCIIYWLKKISSESPLTRVGREKILTLQEDSPGKCSDASSKGSLNRQSFKDVHTSEEARGSMSNQDGAFVQDEIIRRRELALRQHAFFQLRLHIRRGANLMAMDRCGKRIIPNDYVRPNGRNLTWRYYIYI